MNQDPYKTVVDRLYPGAVLRATVRLTGGVSADVFRLDVTLPEGDRTNLVLRVHGASHSGHPVDLEHELLHALHRYGMPVPEPLLVDWSRSVLPSPFLVMSYVNGTTAIPSNQQERYIDAMAALLVTVHEVAIAKLPTLSCRVDPRDGLFEYLPQGAVWEGLRIHLRSLPDTVYKASPTLLHGDFWPENLLWHDGAIAAILDWEDAAIGDPLADVAGCRIELRYKFGKASMLRFTRAYARRRAVDPTRLALWQIYVAAAALRFMGEWGLERTLEARMRRVATTSIREAEAALMDQRGLL